MIRKGEKLALGSVLLDKLMKLGHLLMTRKGEKTSALGSVFLITNEVRSSINDQRRRKTLVLSSVFLNNG